MSRGLRLIAALMLVLAACGGGDEGGGDPTTAAPGDDGTVAPTTTTTTTTTAPAVTVGDDFCEWLIAYAENAELSIMGTSPADLEATLNANVDAINQALAIAPGEVESDVQLFANAYGGFADFFSDYDYNIFAIPEDAFDDPRLMAMEDPELVAAGDRIEDFCGIDDLIADPPGAPGGGGGGPVTPLPGAQLPADFPPDLVPPGGEVVSSVSAAGGESVTFSLDGLTDDIIDFYTELLGPPASNIPDPKGALWVTTYEGQQLTVTVAEISATQVQVNVTII